MRENYPKVVWIYATEAIQMHRFGATKILVEGVARTMCSPNITWIEAVKKEVFFSYKGDP